MADDKEPQRRRAGKTALIVKVPEAEPLVGALRQRYDSSAAAGVPAHVTVLCPFLDESRIDSEVIGALRELMGEQPAFDLRFAGFGRFPDVLYLAPEPAAPLRALTAAVFGRWPEAPPYDGEFDEVIPHLTVAHGQSPETYDAIEAELTDGDGDNGGNNNGGGGLLPVSARVTSVHLYLCDERERWRERRAFALGVGAGTTPR